MADTEQLAIALSNDRKRLLERLREAKTCLNSRYDKFFQRKHQRFDFERKRLVGHSGFYLQWTTRLQPEQPESYENQQTSVGCVQLEREVAI